MSEEETTQVADDANDAAEQHTPDSAAPTVDDASQSAGDVAGDTTSIEAQLAAAQKLAQDNLEGRQRTLAEFQNYKKRVERELAERYQLATLDVLKQLLPIVDDFERGMANIPEEVSGQAWLEGIQLIVRKFQKLLDDHDVIAVDATGEVFDPSRHEAVGIDPDAEVESGYVSVTLQKGYMSGNRVLRPAIVRVAG